MDNHICVCVCVWSLNLYPARNICEESGNRHYNERIKATFFCLAKSALR